MTRKEFMARSVLSVGALFFPEAFTSIFAKTADLLPTEYLDLENIIIGSGYGGAVSALRLCEAGHKATILEMGLNWEKSRIKYSSMRHPGKSSAWLRTKTIAPFFNVFRIKKFTGTLDRLDFPNIKIWVGRGVGGGSLVNGGMAVVPKKEYFKEIFPTLDADLFYRKYFPLVCTEMGVNIADEKFLNYCKYYKYNKIGEKEARKAGFKTFRVPNVYDFKYMEKEYRNEVPRSALAGEVIYGNNYGKKSLDKTYLKKAEMTGNLKILDLHQVHLITQNEDGNYTLDVSEMDTLGNILRKKRITAKRLILSAGTMGSLELLLKSSAANAIKIDENVGKIWGNNGNFMTGRNWVNAFSGGMGIHQSAIPVGGIDNWNDPQNPFFVELAPLPMGLNVATALYLMINKVPHPGSVSYDKEKGKIVLNWNAENTKNMKENADYFIKKMNRHNGGTRAHFLFNDGFGADICYHPLGGVVLGKATDGIGRLNGHRNLYVLDGSLIPGTIGVNPFLSISAIAEYCMERILTGDF